jgi:uncharacterized protein involved in outer membrane biogenesis
MRQKRWIWVGGVIAGLMIVVVALAFFMDAPLRRYIEREMNSRLHGYTVRIGRLDLHPLSFSVDVYDVVIMQDANPDPPIVRVPNLDASVHWRALLSGRVVSDVLVDRPNIHLNLQQIRQEAADDVPVDKRGWQEAIQAVLPLQLNELQVIDGEVAYIDEAPSQPLHLSQMQLRAGNIRNVRSAQGVYPSDISLEATVFESGRISAQGYADFLSVPHLAIKAHLALENLQLDYFRPIASRHNVAVRQGTLSAEGEIEFAPSIKVVHLQRATIQRVQVDYVHTGRTVATARQTAQKAQEKAREVSNTPGLLLRADELRLIDGNIGVINKAEQPNYRVFLAPVEAHITNFSNQLKEGTAAAKVTGKFMGSGQTVVGATFRPEIKGPDFSLAASIENTRMQDMNDLLRAHGNLDVVHGFFSVYSELGVRNGMVRGYVKPLFRDLDVYDPRQDREKALFQKIYEGLVGGVGKLLENIPRDEVATKADIAGRLEDPQADTWQVLGRLIQNAFFQSILPGFENERGRAAR